MGKSQIADQAYHRNAHRLTVLSDTFKRSARSFCVIPLAFLNAAMNLPMVFSPWSFLLDMWYVRLYSTILTERTPPKRERMTLKIREFRKTIAMRCHDGSKSSMVSSNRSGCSQQTASAEITYSTKNPACRSSSTSRRKACSSLHRRVCRWMPPVRSDRGRMPWARAFSTNWATS